ncbi:hypothetical protein [Sphingomonas humi]|uniref:DUF5666 domain-containing protein n=1 Tax=Sphingomonas humi TaxID=335630 RepID=A0ABP7S3D8_9SPHN
MKARFLLTLPLLCAAPAFAQEGPLANPEIAASNSSFLIKMNTSISTTNSKVGDRVSGEVIDPPQLRGAVAEGKVDRADHAILGFSFETLRVQGQDFPIQSRLVSITSSKGNEGRDDLDQRVRIEGVGIIAFGTRSALDEGAEVRITAWKR